MASSREAVPPVGWPRRMLAWVWLAYTAFVIYGSLIPWHFVRRDFQEAGQAWARVVSEQRGAGGASDWATNVLLFIPLGFLTLAVLWPSVQRRIRIPATVLALAICVLLTGAIEFLQLFVPGRTTSYYDIKAETIGAVIGVSAWWVIGEYVVAWLARFRSVFGSIGRLRRVLAIYTVLLFAYQLLPLDLTISPGQLVDKWRAGRVVLVPLLSYEQDWAWALYGVATDVALWIPVGLLAALSTRRHSLAYAAAAAALLEALQLFVYSRVTDVNDVLAGGIGAWLGATLARRWMKAIRQEETTPRWVLPWVAVLTLWAAAVVTLYWYPFDFQLSGAIVRDRIGELAKVPLHAYYWSTELTAVSEMLRKITFFVPGGALMAIPRVQLRTGVARGAWTAIAAVLIVGFAAAIELGQVALPGKVLDSGDPLLQIVGASIGWCCVVLVLGPRAASNAARTLRSEPLSPAWQMAFCVALTMAVIWVVGQMPGTPYNVRELLGGSILQTAALVSALFTAIVLPVWIVCRSWTLWSASVFPVFVLIHGTLVFSMLLLGAPVESLHDVLGSPVLGWPGDLELLGRFVGLFASVSIVLTLAAALVRCREPRGRAWLATAAAWAIPVLVVSYLVVVVGADTDNLVELLAFSASFPAWLAVWGAFGALAASGSAWAGCRAFRSPRCVTAAAVTIAAIPVGFALANFGLESRVVKYDRTFSALQFLLSADRAHYAHFGELMVRFAVAALGLVAGIAIVQYPMFRLCNSPRARASNAAPDPGVDQSGQRGNGSLNTA